MAGGHLNSSNSNGRKIGGHNFGNIPGNSKVAGGGQQAVGSSNETNQ